MGGTSRNTNLLLNFFPHIFFPQNSSEFRIIFNTCKKDINKLGEITLFFSDFAKKKFLTCQYTLRKNVAINKICRKMILETCFYGFFFHFIEIFWNVCRSEFERNWSKTKFPKLREIYFSKFLHHMKMNYNTKKRFKCMILLIN